MPHTYFLTLSDVNLFSVVSPRTTVATIDLSFFWQSAEISLSGGRTQWNESRPEESAGRSYEIRYNYCPLRARGTGGSL